METHRRPLQWVARVDAGAKSRGDPMRSITPSRPTCLALARGLWGAIAMAALVGVAQAASMAPVAAENGMVVTAQHLATEVIDAA